MRDLVWMQITSGRGPVECQLAVAHLVRVVRAEAAVAGVAAEVLDVREGAVRSGYLSALLRLEGDGVAAFAARYAGSVQWVCPSPIRPRHRRKNWFIGVDVFAVPQATSTTLKPADVVFEAMRAGGAGGQHVNKTESAVRATHRPSGLVVTAREERSQHQNRRLALARLADLLAAGAQAQRASQDAQLWAQHDTLERGRAVATFIGPDFVRKT